MNSGVDSSDFLFLGWTIVNSCEIVTLPSYFMMDCHTLITFMMDCHTLITFDSFQSLVPYYTYVGDHIL